MRILIGAVAALCLADLCVAGCASESKPAAPAVAKAAPAAAPAATKTAVKNDPDRKICRTVTDTGSHNSRKICATAAEWKASGQ